MTQEEKVTLYALGALEAQEADEVRLELAESPQLQTLLARDRALATLILASVEPVQPPPALKQRLMEHIDASLPAAPSPSSSLAGPAIGPRRIQRKPRDEAAGPSFTRLRDERPQRAWLSRVFTGLSTTAAAIAVAVAVLLAIRLQQAEQEATTLREQAAQLQSDAGTTRKALDAATARVTQLERDLGQIQVTLAQTQETLVQSQSDAQRLTQEVATLRAFIGEKEAALAQAQMELSVLLQPGVRVAVLPGVADGYRTATVTVFYAPQSTTAYVSVANLPPLPPEQTYQVWLIKRNQRAPSRVFNTDASGVSRLIVQSNEPFSTFQNISITIEPAGGSETPNPAGPIVLGRL